MKITLKILCNFLVFLLLNVWLTSCTIGKRRASFSNMPEKPIVIIQDNKITVLTSNSLLNSAVANYKVKHKIDTLNKEINIWGYNGLVNKRSKNKFELHAKGLNKTQLEKYDFYWIDPDKSRHELQIKK